MAKLLNVKLSQTSQQGEKSEITSAEPANMQLGVLHWPLNNLIFLHGEGFSSSSPMSQLTWKLAAYYTHEQKHM